MTEIITHIKADTSEVEKALVHLKSLSSEFSEQLAGGMVKTIQQGKSLEDVLKKIGLNLAGMALEAGFKPLTGMLGAAFGGGAIGDIVRNIVPFSKGGVISSPNYFPLGGGVGVAGEAGAEAILPLQRGPDGRLGVGMSGAKSSPVHVVFNITTSDVSSFRKSEAQITGMLARAVERGTKTF